MIPAETRETFFDADTHLLTPKWRAGVHVNRYGGIETRLRCSGCQPRDATHGLLCKTCHAQMHGWLAGGHTLAWAHDWLAADIQPGQNNAGGDKIRASRTPPAALNLTIHDLRQDINAWFARWIGATCIQHNLTGPRWWRTRIDRARRRRSRGIDDAGDWRAQLPRNRHELEDGRQFLAAWLDRIETDAELVLPMYEEAYDLMRRVQQAAPWEARPRNLRGISCPECQREALALYEGCDWVECRRCDAFFERDRYDIWSEIAEAERAA